MDKTIKIYCEGINDSWDKQILDLILDDVIGKRPMIEPIGGKKGVGSLINFDAEKLIKPNYFFFFRDRDFDKPIPINEELILDSKAKGIWCFSFRTTIENYLFNPKVLFEFLQAKSLLDKFDIKTENDVKEKMIEAARSIQNYQAVRHTLGALRENLDLGSSFMDKSGKLPSDLSLDFCKTKALEKIKETKDKTKKWGDFETELNKFLTIFNEEGFYENLKFLIWFQGKDFAAALRKTLLDFPSQDFYKYSMKHFDYTQFADLVQLKNLIQNKIDE